MRPFAAPALLAAAGFATWLAWIAYGVLCDGGCAGRPWPLIAQLVTGCAGFLFAAAAAEATATGAGARARVATTATNSHIRRLGGVTHSRGLIRMARGPERT